MRDEKLKNLESSVTWLRNESIRLAGNIERLTEDSKSLSMQLKESQAEVKVWKAQAVNTKAYNLVLKETIEKLKSPQLIEKYERQGALKHMKKEDLVSEQMDKIDEDIQT